MEEIHCPNIVDFEASGFGPSSYPIEIGIAKASGERYCALIKPHEEWLHWSKKAQALHGIERRTLVKKGKSIEQVCAEVNQFLGSSDIFSDALSHDQSWLTRLFSSANTLPSFNLRAIEHIMNEAQFAIWDEIKQQINEELKLVRHRASSDALIIQQTYIQTRLQISTGLKKNQVYSFA